VSFLFFVSAGMNEMQVELLSRMSMFIGVMFENIEMGGSAGISRASKAGGFLCTLRFIA